MHIKLPDAMHVCRRTHLWSESTLVLCQFSFNHASRMYTRMRVMRCESETKEAAGEKKTVLVVDRNRILHRECHIATYHISVHYTTVTIIIIINLLFFANKREKILWYFSTHGRVEIMQCLEKISHSTHRQYHISTSTSSIAYFTFVTNCVHISYNNM